MDEVEIDTIIKPAAFVRIKFDNIASEYIYEVIEPQLTDDESELLDLLKGSLTVTLNLTDRKKPEERSEMLRQGTDELLKNFDIVLNPVSKERILYYLRRDFIGYGVIDVMMIDPNVEDCSCDGVGIPLYIFHRKYGSIKSNIMFNDDWSWTPSWSGWPRSAASTSPWPTRCWMPPSPTVRVSTQRWASTSPSGAPPSPSGGSRRTRSPRWTWSSSRP